MTTLLVYYLSEVSTEIIKQEFQLSFSIKEICGNNRYPTRIDFHDETGCI